MTSRHACAGIYNTNRRTARAAGQWDRISRNADLLPYLVYELGPSERHREEHVAWAGLCLKIDDPFWNTHYPPNGWGCKCRVRQVASPPEGARTVAPRAELREWTNPATGEVRLVARGIDPGWDYHVGGQRTLGVNAAWLRRCERAVESCGAGAAARMVERHVAGPGFRWFVERPRAREKAYWGARPGLVEATPAGVLSVEAAAGMGADSLVVRLTEKVMHKQAVHHPELAAEAYRRLPEILRASPVHDKGRWIFKSTVELGGKRRSVRVVVEVLASGQPLIVSVRRERKKGR